MSELEDFLKDPEGWVKRKKKHQEHRIEDALNYLERQRAILEQVYEETIEAYGREHENDMKRAARWAKEHGMTLEGLDDLRTLQNETD